MKHAETTEWLIVNYVEGIMTSRNVASICCYYNIHPNGQLACKIDNPHRSTSQHHHNECMQSWEGQLSPPTSQFSSLLSDMIITSVERQEELEDPHWRSLYSMWPPNFILTIWHLHTYLTCAQVIKLQCLCRR